jgi:hypothetical protein
LVGDDLRVSQTTEQRNMTEKSSGLPHKTRDDPSYKIALEVRLARCSLHRQKL